MTWQHRSDHYKKLGNSNIHAFQLIVSFTIVSLLVALVAGIFMKRL